MPKAIKFQKGLPKANFSAKTSRKGTDSYARKALARVNAFAKKTKI